MQAELLKMITRERELLCFSPCVQSLKYQSSKFEVSKFQSSKCQNFKVQILKFQSSKFQSLQCGLSLPDVGGNHIHRRRRSAHAPLPPQATQSANTEAPQPMPAKTTATSGSSLNRATMAAVPTWRTPVRSPEPADDPRSTRGPISFSAWRIGSVTQILHTNDCGLLTRIHRHRNDRARTVPIVARAAPAHACTPLSLSLSRLAKALAPGSPIPW